MISVSDLLHPIAFQAPRRITPESAWVEHTPFAMNLVALLRPALLVELGTHSGDSYCAFCQAVDLLGADTRCFAVDTWQGDAHSGGYGDEVLAELRAHHDPLYGRFSRLLRVTFDEALQNFTDGSIDLLHVDGFHTYDQVKKDYESWAPKLSRHAVVLFHDTNVRERDFGVWRFWRELRERHPSFEFAHGHGLGMLSAGSEVPEALAPLFAADERRTEEIREIFFALGQRPALGRELASAHRSSRATAVELDAAQRALAAAQQELAAQAERSEDAARERELRAQAEAALATQEAALAAQRRDLEIILSSRAWRTVQRYRGARDLLVGRRDAPAWNGAGKLPKAWHYLREHGARAAAAKTVAVLRRDLRRRAGDAPEARGSSATTAVPGTLAELVRSHFRSLEPLRTSVAPTDVRRLNLVTDSINTGSLFGGVGTAIVLGALLAERRGWGLRVVTRTELAEPSNFQKVLAAAGIRCDRNVEFTYAPAGSPRHTLDVSNDDVFLTTSWWTTRSVADSVDPARIVYLLQEDERMFYPLGDDHLRASELLRHGAIRVIVNSKLLFDHLVAEGYDNVARAGMWFEPSFPTSAFHPNWNARRAKRNFLFYARPQNQRNLFYRGAEAIDGAVARGVLDPARWDIFFVGKDLPDVRVTASWRPQLVPTLPWGEYAALVRSMDLGLSLMYTPHPSYPPLDLAASGAVAVTNRFGLKRDLSAYSPNILCSDLDVDALVERIADGVRLAEDTATRRANYDRSGFLRDWRVSFEAVLASLDEV